ncbi:MAG: tRNA lysidine(34) synthetase TilS [Acidobacteriota bacterium]
MLRQPAEDRDSLSSTLTPVLRALSRCVDRADANPPTSGEGLLIAFSGGPDSTALLLAAQELRQRGGPRWIAAHYDHAADGDSARRAERAEAQCRNLGVQCVVERRSQPWPPGLSPEAAARDLRYRFLESVRRQHGLRWILTAHHRDDQAETLLLRLAFGSGWEGLEGIRWRRDRVLRPLLDLPQRTLQTLLQEVGVEAVQDPTNQDWRQPRARLRHALMPILLEQEPQLRSRLHSLARAAGRARRALDQRWAGQLRAQFGREEALLPRAALAALPGPTMDSALAWLHRRAGARYPATTPARGELQRQLTSPNVLGCDVGGGWRWEGSCGWLRLAREQLGPPEAFHLERQVEAAPERLRIQLPSSDLQIDLQTSRRRTRPARSREATAQSRSRAFSIDLATPQGTPLLFRSRRPGDRITTRGRRARSLKGLFDKARLPRWWRDRWPLLEISGTICWVPGVATAAPTLPDSHRPQRWVRITLRRRNDQKSGVEKLTNPSNPGLVHRSFCTDG